MKQYQDVFQRYEKKYRMNPQTFTLLLKELEPYFAPDDYGLHTICNLYYDTDDYQLIRTSLEKPIYKEKLRLRSYGVPKNGTPVFLELKKKFKGVVYKRRISLSLEQAAAYLNGSCTPDEAVGRGGTQILSEIDWFLDRYQPTAKVYLAYDRIAFFGKENPDLRITFDQRIRYRDYQLDLERGDWGTLLLDPGEVLMEIKIPGTMPLWLSEILSALCLYPSSFSKYGYCYQNYLIPQLQTQKGGILCA